VFFIVQAKGPGEVLEYTTSWLVSFVLFISAAIVGVFIRMRRGRCQQGGEYAITDRVDCFWYPESGPKSLVFGHHAMELLGSPYLKMSAVKVLRLRPCLGS
jgi:hypothetical protein